MTDETSRSIERASGADLGRFFDLSTDLLCVVGLDGYVKELNPAWERTLGYPIGELISKPFAEFLHPDDVARVLAELKRVTEGEETRGLECRIRCRDGSYRSVWWSPRVAVENGLLYAVARDITEQRMEQESLRQSEASFELLAEAVERHLITIREQAHLLEAAHDAMFVRDLEGRVLFWNRAAEELYGWTRVEALGRELHSLLETEFPRPFESIKVELLELGRWEGQLSHRRWDGTRILVDSRWVLHREDESADPVVLEINTDVTQRRRVEADLRESEARFRTVFESAAVGMALLDMEGRLVEANAALEQLLGHGTDELLSRPLADFVQPGSEQDERERYERLVSGERSGYRLEQRFLRKDGTAIPVRVTVSLVRDQAGQPEFVARMVEDMSLALVDELTGLGNRRALFAYGQQQLKVAEREHLSPAVVFVDVDGTKSINDTFGHAEGDRALVDVAQVLTRTFRASDFAARLGGDEFCVVMFQGDDPQHAVERLHRELRNWNRQVRRPYRLSVSAGAARFDWENPRPIEELIGEADRAMYLAKRKSSF